jgi:hypothetical protein
MLCPHTTICVSDWMLLYIRPHTTIYVSAYYYYYMYVCTYT